MAFWSKETVPTSLNEDEQGAKINERAAVLQRVAMEGSTGSSETLTALANALGSEAAVIVMQHPNLQHSGTEQLANALDAMLDLLSDQVRMFAYVKATGSLPSAPTDAESPHRRLNPALFDRGAKINRRANELRRIAARGLPGSDVIVALQSALGDEVAATVLLRNPSFSPDQKVHVIDQMLDAICPGVREAAYMAADLPSPPQNDEGRDLSAEEFNGLTTRIVNEATKNNTPVNGALTATAKALGVLISTLAQRPGVSAEQLVKFSQNAIAEFAREASTFIRRKS